MGTAPYAAGTDVSETIGGKEYGRSLLRDSAGTDAMGVVGASPAANTLLGRLKAVVDAIGSLATLVGLSTAADKFAVITPNDNTVLNPTPKSLVIAGAGNIRLKGADDVVVEFPVPAGIELHVRPKSVMVATSNAATGIIALNP